ncbi:uncharacterized protein TRAVEDRAFT_48138 [Trametes versicolor FP-101664 SS1]|uniref:uncharacterized protein n=1 Tax=Trametes versicolor (strain FP-101664) TaxID=717944 RepID=UPI00046231AB|nr:uncharacterized protein TRAVEDRAFT_48138 [Trametes versicolor FP-101664 SS1]EIW59011.1 hypothetical protein TRAVEDRAFT_48138 [Trametes versicolor FP-101664 SS1]
MPPSSPSPKRYASAATLESVSHATPAHSRVVPGSSVVRLVASASPCADAERLASVVTSLDVTNASYLRVFGKLRTGDAWLEELRVVGWLTEIQFRTVLHCVHSKRMVSATG